MKPTIVLVHGAFAESASWNNVIDSLAAAGHPVIAVPNPLRSSAADAAAVGDVLRTVDGPVVLVGHSYGGVGVPHRPAGPRPITRVGSAGGLPPAPRGTRHPAAAAVP